MTAAEQILDALKLVVGKDVNEYAIPVINTIIEKHESAQLSAKEQEIVNLERGIAGYSKEVSELQKIASDQEMEITDLKTCVDNFSDMYQEKCTELASVRADYDDQSLKVKRQADHIEVLQAENVTLQEKVRIYYQYRGSANRAAEEEIKSLTARLKGTENEILRKRCEDLEAVLEMNDKAKNELRKKGYGWTGLDLLKTVELVPSSGEPN